MAQGEEIENGKVVRRGADQRGSEKQGLGEQARDIHDVVGGRGTGEGGLPMIVLSDFF
jgi:hypothetical protein